MKDGSWPAPPEGIAEAVLDAARIARLGVAVVAAGGGRAEPVWYNPAASEILGRSIHELLSMDPYALLAADSRGATTLVGWREQREPRGERPKRVTVVRPDGAPVVLEVSVAATEAHGRRLAIAFFRDATEQRRLEDALRRSDARFRPLVEASPDAVFICRVDGVIVYANPAAVRVLGYPAADALVGLEMASLYHPEERALLRERLGRVMSGERLPPRQYRLLRKDGTTIVLEMTGDAIVFDGAPALLGVGRDVTEREEMQRQLARADRLAALGLLAAAVAHEINNPLTFVSLGLQALQRKLEALPDSPARDELIALLEPMRGGTERVADIVRDLRAYARDEDDTPSDIDVVTVIAAAERMAAHHLRHRTRLVRRVRGEPKVRGHAGRLEQVVLNLLVNAAQAFPPDARDPMVAVGCEERDGIVEITVEDNAGGIPEEVRARVFDPFFTTKSAEDGTGLGLWICHGIVTSMGGTIAIESTTGRGTLVRVRLPAWSCASATPERPAREPSSALRRLRVLVVDDEPTLGRLITLLLSGEHDVEAVTSAADALACMERDPAYDVVICDVMMPRASGPDLHQIVARRWPELASRFVFMSGGALTDKARDYLATTPLPLLEKPFTSEVLRAALGRVSG